MILGPCTKIHLSFLILAAVLPAVASPLAVSAEEPDGVNWPSFRGPSAGGIAEGFSTPAQWDASESRNVKWKTALPGLGHSCPVIWGNRIFVTTAVSGKKDPKLKVGLYGNIASVEDNTVHTWQVLCLDKQTGRILWSRIAHSGIPKIKRHTKATHANSTPATDGRHVVVFFGSEGLYCYDLDGKLRWKKHLGTLDSGYYVVPQAQWGFASSPIIFENMVIVQCDVQQNSFIAAFDLSDGTELWRTARNDVPTWSTPTLHKSARRAQIIVNGYKHIGGYDATTGKELWKLTGGGDIPVPTPVVGHDLVFITNAHGRSAPLYAISPGARGDISLKDDATTNKHIAWSTARNGAYMQTPLVYGDYLYSCTDRGVLMCYDARTGKRLYRNRLGGGSAGFTASPVAADGKLYFTSEEGDVFVVKADAAFEVLSKNPLHAVCMATPAISEGTLFFRTQGHLVAIAETPHTPAD